MRHYISSLLNVLTLCVVFLCCKKDDNTIPPPGNQPPAITPIGTPAGTPASKNIGTAGGSIVSSDGILELTIPAGAVSSNTDFTIQPVTNETPGGIGLSYHLMPEGINFSKPVRITFHYTAEDIVGTHPYLLFIAYQDGARAWRADFKKRNVDTIAKTVSLDINHFSIWTLGDNLVINVTPSSTDVYENETRQLRVNLVDRNESSSSGDDELPSLPQETLLPDNAVSNWKINGGNGNSSDGTITGTGNTVTYTAPASIEDRRVVQVSVELNYQLSFFNNGQLVSSVNSLILFLNITLLPSIFEYSVALDFKDAGISGYTPGQVYSDKATFDLTVQKTKDAQGIPVVILLGSNYVNEAPTVVPASQKYNNPGGSTFTWQWVADGIGQVNIVDITLNSFDDSTVNIEFIHANTVYPGFNWRTTGPDNSGSSAATPLGGSFGMPPGMTLKLKDETQIFKQSDGHPWITVVPK